MSLTTRLNRHNHYGKFPTRELDFRTISPSWATVILSGIPSDLKATINLDVFSMVADNDISVRWRICG